jgi:MtN3 and saliva related transmembrane protein
VIKILGLLAGFLTTISFLPQVIKSLRTRHMDDFNVWFLILMIIGLSLWTLYGFMIKQLPIIIANIATISLNLILLILKIRYQKHQ